MVLRARLLLLLLTTGTAVRSSPAAGAPSASVSVEVAAGHDDNMFLATSPVASDPLLRLGGWFAGVSPAVAGGVTFGGNRLQGSYAGDLRQADEVGRLTYHEGELLFLSAPLGPLRLHLVALAGRFDASRHPDDHFVLLGGEGGVRLSLGQALRMRVRYHAERRWLGADGATSDMLHLVEARLPWSVATWLEIGPHASLLRVQPRASPADAAFQRLRGGLHADLLAGPLHVSTDVWGGTLALGARTIETHIGGRIEARVSVGRFVELFAGADSGGPHLGGRQPGLRAPGVHRGHRPDRHLRVALGPGATRRGRASRCRARPGPLPAAGGRRRRGGGGRILGWVADARPPAAGDARARPVRGLGRSARR